MKERSQSRVASFSCLWTSLDSIKESGRLVLLLGEVQVDRNNLCVAAHILKDLEGVDPDRFQTAVNLLSKFQPSSSSETSNLNLKVDI